MLVDNQGNREALVSLDQEELLVQRVRLALLVLVDRWAILDSRVLKVYRDLLETVASQVTLDHLVRQVQSVSQVSLVIQAHQVCVVALVLQVIYTLTLITYFS